MPDPAAGAPEPGGAAEDASHDTAPDRTPTTAPGRVAVGRINGAWGLRGHVKVTPLSTNPDRLTAGSVVLVEGRPTKILEVVSPQGFPMIRFQGYPDRTAAERLRGTLIEINEADLPPLPDDEYYVDDLIGLDVVTTEGEPIGRITEVLATGANDVYVVARPGLRDVLIPAINDVVRSVDLGARRMVIEVMPGLLD